MIFFLIGSLVNVVAIWPARRGPIVLLWLVYHAMLALAFVWPTLITPGIGYRRGHLVPGPTLVGLLAVLAIEAGALAVTRLETAHGPGSVAAMKTAVMCFGSFVLVCVVAIVLMAMLEIGMY